MSKKIIKDKSSFVVVLLGILISIGLVAASVYATSIGSSIVVTNNASIGSNLTVSGSTNLATTTISGGLNAFTLLGGITGSGSPDISGIGNFSGANLSLTGNATTTNLAVTGTSYLGTVSSGTWQGATIADAYIANDLTISGGTINNTSIGATTASTGAFTTLTASTSTLATTTIAGPFTVNSSGTITKGTWQASILGLAYGGTASNLTAVSGGIVYSNSSALAISSAGTSGQALISGGTSAPTWFAPTQGSILFAGASGILSQDNANLFWDDTNNRLGIGTTTPQTDLHVVRTASTTVRVGDIDKTGCLELGDSASGAIVYITASGSTITATTTKPAICE